MATRTMTAAAATLTQTRSSSSPTKKTAELEVVNYELLNAGDDNEIKKLVHAATSRGIFFLDTSGPSAAQVTADVPKVLAAQCKFFALSRDEKRTFERSEPERGYHKSDKPNVETLLLSREVELNGKLELPDELRSVSTQLANISNFTDTALRDMYRTLCKSASPPMSTVAAESPEAPNYTNLTLGFSLEEPGAFLIPEHADSGLITLLYYDLPSLEILEPVTGDWEVVQPRPDLQVCYIGKHFSDASGGRFKAAAHRVVNPETGWALVVYLLHPGLDQVDDPGYSR